MKKKIFAIMMATGLTVLTACGSSETTQTAETEAIVTADQMSENETQKETGTVEDATQEAEEAPLEVHTVHISDWAYDGLQYISKSFLIGKDGDKYFLVNAETGEKVSDTWTSNSGEDYPYEFDAVICNLQDGDFIGIINQDDGTYVSALFDGSDGKGLFSGKGKAYLSDYQDDLLVTTSDESYAFLTRENPGNLYRRDKENYHTWASSYGMVFTNFIYYKYEKDAWTWTFDSESLIDAMKRDDWSNIGDEEIGYQTYTYDGATVNIWPNVANKEGWVRSELVYDVTVDENDKLSIGDVKHGFYNIKTNEFVNDPIEEIASCSYFTEDNGRNICTVTDGRAALAVGKTADEKILYQIFDLASRDFATEDQYQYVGSFGYYKRVGVQNADGKWGFIDDVTMEHVGDWYDAASAFCNGFALVIIDGKAKLIDEDFNVVSDEFDAEEALPVIDYYTFSDLNGKSVFFVKDSSEKYHLATVE